MLITTQFPSSYKEFAIKYATWLIHRSATSKFLNEKLKPYKVWTDRTTNKGGVHTFGYMAFCLVPKLKRDHKLPLASEWLFATTKVSLD